MVSVATNVGATIEHWLNKLQLGKYKIELVIYIVFYRVKQMTIVLIEFFVKLVFFKAI